MKTTQIEQLRQCKGKVVKITCSDGEVLEAKIIHIDDEYQDVVYDLISSTTPEKYKQNTSGAYVIRWHDIAEFA